MVCSGSCKQNSPPIATLPENSDLLEEMLMKMEDVS